jgi:hypothetical protein
MCHHRRVRSRINTPTTTAGTAKSMKRFVGQQYTAATTARTATNAISTLDSSWLGVCRERIVASDYREYMNLFALKARWIRSSVLELFQTSLYNLYFPFD